MAKLTLKFKDNILNEYQFNSDITIGRVQGNDIVIDNTAVSGKHAAIEVAGDNFILKDMGSLNGIFVNEKKVKEHKLREGDDILVGKHILRFDLDPGGTMIGAGSRDDHEMSGMTMCLDTRQYKEMMENISQKKEPQKAAPSKRAESREPPPPQMRGKLIYESKATGRPTEIFLEKHATIIGKKADCDIRIHGFLCGETAAIIERRKDQFLIRHCGGFSKTKVNGERVQGLKLLSDGDNIKIGANNLFFREVL